MSKGPGRVERALKAILEAEGDEAAFPIEELCGLIYAQAGYTYPPLKQHKLAIVRAAKNIIRRGGNYGWYRGDRGRGSRKILYVPDNVTAYGKACLMSDTPRPIGWWDKERLRHMLNLEHNQCAMQPGGSWWSRVELYKAERCGDHARVAMLRAESQARLDRLASELRALLAG